MLWQQSTASHPLFFYPLCCPILCRTLGLFYYVQFLLWSIFNLFQCKCNKVKNCNWVSSLKKILQRLRWKKQNRTIQIKRSVWPCTTCWLQHSIPMKTQGKISSDPLKSMISHSFPTCLLMFGLLPKKQIVVFTVCLEVQKFLLLLFNC